METPYSKAWAEFIKSDGKRLLAFSSSAVDAEKYRENRIRCAFDAGWNAMSKFMVELSESPPHG